MRDGCEHVDLTKDHAREVDRTRLAMEADKQDAPTAASASERTRRRMRCSARLYDDIEPFAITDLKQQLSKIVACRVNDLSRPEGRRGRQALVVDVNGDDTSAAIATRGAGDEERANTAHTDHGQSLGWALRHPRQGM